MERRREYSSAGPPAFGAQLRYGRREGRLPVSARETAEIVMCVPSLVPSLATQIKSSSLLLLNQVGDQAPASCRLIPPNGGGGAEGLIGHAG